MVLILEALSRISKMWQCGHVSAAGRQPSLLELNDLDVANDFAKCVFLHQVVEQLFDLLVEHSTDNVRTIVAGHVLEHFHLFLVCDDGASPRALLPGTRLQSQSLAVTENSRTDGQRTAYFGVDDDGAQYFVFPKRAGSDIGALNMARGALAQFESDDFEVLSQNGRNIFRKSYAPGPLITGPLNIQRRTVIPENTDFAIRRRNVPSALASSLAKSIFPVWQSRYFDCCVLLCCMPIFL